MSSIRNDAAGAVIATGSLVTVNAEATLPQSRRFAVGTGITLTDGGAGSTLTISYSNNGVTYAKFQQPAASSLVGNPTGGLANAQDVGISSSLRFNGTTLDFNTVANLSVMANVSGGVAVPIARTITQFLDGMIGPTRGQIIVRGAANWQPLNVGGINTVLRSDGTDPNWGVVTIAMGGTGQTTQQAAFDALAPTPTRAGDLTYWNGTHYVNLAGNNVGTKVLQEDSSGVPSWVAPGTLTRVTNTLGADVNLGTANTYFTGPTCAQGTSGIWMCIGQVTCVDTGATVYKAKLWDGTTVIASGSFFAAANAQVIIALSGIISTPAGNIRIDVNDTLNNTGKIKFNDSGNSKDATLSVVQIG
jgi:hypothetical protein